MRAVTCRVQSDGLAGMARRAAALLHRKVKRSMVAIAGPAERSPHPFQVLPLPVFPVLKVPKCPPSPLARSLFPLSSSSSVRLVYPTRTKRRMRGENVVFRGQEFFSGPLRNCSFNWNARRLCPPCVVICGRPKLSFLCAFCSDRL